MSWRYPLGLFQAIGVELEYMIVDRVSLEVRPVADAVIHAEAGSYESEIERGDVAWSNELARHVIELKTNGPVPRLAGLEKLMAGEIGRVEEHLSGLGARLMPTAMHPWMDPVRQFELWPHGSREIYETFHRIFDCTGHGWANLQSVHLNLPFADPDEFGRLHAAIRFLLPLLPALAASSPLAEGRASGQLDTRLEVYRTNARRVPSVSGDVIPEPIYTREGYEGELLGRIYADLAPLDPGGVLRHEWVNARGCIARFDRGAIEIRVLDVQECPAADLAIGAAVVAVLRALTRRPPARQEALRGFGTDELVRLLRATVAQGDRAAVDDAGYLEVLGLPLAPGAPAGAVWRALLERDGAGDPDVEAFAPVLELLLREGCLARRILHRIGGSPTPDAIHAVYGELCECLRHGRLLTGPS